MVNKIFIFQIPAYYPIKIKCVGPDHPKPVEGVQPEQDHQEPYNDTASIAGIDCVVNIRGGVVVPSPVLVVPSPEIQLGQCNMNPVIHISIIGPPVTSTLGYYQVLSKLQLK